MLISCSQKKSTMDQQTVTAIRKEPSQTQQHELLNFTQSVVELESEIFQKARNPNQRVQNDESPLTPNLPMGNDGFVCEADHANLVSNKFTDKHSTPATSYCHDEFVKTQINDFSINREKHKNLPSANRQTMEFQSETEPSPRPIHLSSLRLQTDDVPADNSNALNVIHLSRVYFSQQTVSGGQSNQTFQEAPRTEYQMVEKDLKSINKNMDKSPKKHRMAYATHVIPQKKSGTVRTQNASSMSSTNKTNFKGLFQSSSASPSKKSSKKNNSTSELDKYIYFLPAVPRNTPSCTEIRERVPIEKNGENSDSRLEGISVGRRQSGSSKNIEHVPEQVQVVADKEGRVLVVNLAGKKISGAETKSTTTQNPSPKKWSPIIMKEGEMGSGLNNERHKFSESSVRHPLDQTKHVSIKRNRDCTFGIVNSPLDVSPSNNLIVTLPANIAVDNTRNDINNNNECSLHELPHGRRDLVQSHNQNNLIERMYIDVPIAMRDAVIRNNQCFVSQTHGIENHKLPQYCSAKTTELRSYVHNHENSNHSPYKTYSGRPTNVCYSENNGPAIVYIEDNSNGTFHDSRTNLEGNSNNGTFDRAHLEGKSNGTFDHTHLGGNSNRTFDHSSASLNGNSIEPYQLDQPCGVASGNDFNRHKKASLPKTKLNKPNYSVQRDQDEPRQYVPPQKQVKKAAGKRYNDFTNITATSKNKNVPDSSLSQTNRSSSEVQRNAPNSEVDKRYKCDWPACTKAFRHYSFLVLHKRIHTGERPYNCSWKGCTREFRRSDDYQRHYRVHTGVKPYPCLVCGKAFKRSDHRLFHYRSIHQMEEVSGKIMNKLK